MILSNSDFAPAFNVFISFYIVAIPLFAFGLWQQSRTRRKRLADEPAKKQIILGAVDGLSLEESAIHRISTTSPALIRYVIWMIICCTLIYVVFYLVIIDLVHLIAPDVNTNSWQLFKVVVSLMLPLIAAWIVL